MPNSTNVSAVALISCLLWSACAAGGSWAQSQTDGRFDPERVNWTNLSYQINKYFGTVTVGVKLQPVSAMQTEAELLRTPKGTPISIPSACVYKIGVHRTITSTFGADATEQDQVWFDPATAGALGRTRERRGNDDFLKTYRFTAQGVYRFHREPKDSNEVQLPADKWTNTGQNFYGYDVMQMECACASERSILLYAVSAVSFSANQNSLTMCVFGKRQMFRVYLRADGLQELKVNYVEKTQPTEVKREGTVNALKIALEAQPLASDLEEVENFSFLGLHKEIVIFIDPVSRLPLQASGILPIVGKVDLTLSEVILRQTSK